MAAYIIKRFVMLITVVIIISTFLVLVVHLIGGSPARAILGQLATPALIEQARENLHLDAPVYMQVWFFLDSLAHGSLGTTFLSHQSVASVVFNALPHTLILAFCGLACTALVGIPLGAYSATHAGGWFDRVTAVITVGLLSTPSYVVGLYLLLAFTVHWRILPTLSTAGFDEPLAYAQQLILPVASLAVVWIGYIARIVRASMLDVLGADYIRTAAAFGLSGRSIRYRYALKNAVIPAVAALVFAFGELLSSAVFVEVIFSRSGLGRLLVDAVADRAFLLVRGGVLVIAVVYMLTNLIADLSYRFLDPRIRLESADS